MGARIPIPAGLQQRAFRVAEGLAAGLGRERLAGRDLDRPFHGVRTPPSITKGSASGGSGEHGSENDVVARARAYVPLLRADDRFSHSTAAHCWSLPLPRGLEEVHVTTTRRGCRPRGRGVVGHESSRDAAVIRHGMPVSDAVGLFVELATVLGLDDLVAVGDALVLDPELLDPRDPRPWIGIDELTAGIATHGRAPGLPRARRALTHVRVGAESRTETLLRLLLVRSGLPEPELNPVLRARSGRRLGRFDLVYRREGVIVEYDGDQHRTSIRQYEHDIGRLERTREEGWRVVQVRARGLFTQPDETVARVRRALSRRTP